MKNANPYIIEGGVQGKKRLSVLSEILHEYSKALIGSDGNIEGKSFLDVGCGGGDVSIMVAKMVGVHGHVTAIDFDEKIIRLAEDDARRMQINNVSFYTKSAYNISDEDAYDIAYSRFLLSHLTDASLVLNNMVRAIKPGGRIIVEDIDFSGHYCYPERWSFASYVRLFAAAAKNNGQNADIGLTLFQMLRSTRLENVSYDVIQPTFNAGEGKRMAYLTMDRIKTTVIDQQLATPEEVERILSDLETFTKQEDSIISLPRIFRVWGYKR